jgi:hypothetical protein
MIKGANAQSGFTYHLAKIEEQRWRSNWFFTMAKLLEKKPALYHDN